MAKAVGTNKRVAVKKVTNQGDSINSRYNRPGQTKKRYRGQGK